MLIRTTCSRWWDRSSASWAALGRVIVLFPCSSRIVGCAWRAVRPTPSARCWLRVSRGPTRVSRPSTSGRRALLPVTASRCRSRKLPRTFRRRGELRCGRYPPSILRREITTKAPRNDGDLIRGRRGLAATSTRHSRCCVVSPSGALTSTSAAGRPSGPGVDGDSGGGSPAGPVVVTNPAHVGCGVSSRSVRLAFSIPQAVVLAAGRGVHDRRLRRSKSPTLGAAAALRVPSPPWEGKSRLAGKSVRASARCAPWRSPSRAPGTRCPDPVTPRAPPSRSLTGVERDAAREPSGYPAQDPVVLVFGGSQAVRRL